MPTRFPKDTEYVWAKQSDTGWHRAINRAMYEFAPGAWELMPDHPATDAGGNLMPAKNRTSASTEAAAKKASGRQADSDKENS